MTKEERSLRVALLGGRDYSLELCQLCERCREALKMTGAGISIKTENLPSMSLCTTDDVSALIEESQFVLGEGPSLDAYALACPVAEADLATEIRRWPRFGPLVLDAGVQSIFAYPLMAGSAPIGTLNFYRDRRGALSDQQHSDALGVAGLVVDAVLNVQSRTPPGELSSELEAMMERRAVVFQASGVVSFDLRVSVDEALNRLRAYAFANDRKLDEVAREVVARRLLFDDSAGTTGVVQRPNGLET